MIDSLVKEKKNCTGCFACATICPKVCIFMETDAEGFWYPKVDHAKCIDCGKCEDVCPLINRKVIENKPVAYACINKNEQIRLESSSGGVFTLIAEQIISKGGVVFGAGFNNKFEVEHSYVESIEELSKFRGSKYVQSKIGEAYIQAKEFLNMGRTVLFTGTPCQIGGLKSYLGNSYDNLFCLDMICHGVPSPKVWEKYILFREQKAGSQVKRIAFRRKDDGWKRFSVSFYFKNDTEYRQNLHQDLFMRAFLKDICLRPSCYDCQFKKLHRQSDITLADLWGIQYLLPEMDDDKGTSLIFINSHAGQAMLNEIKDKILYQKVDINEAIKYNPSAIKSVKYNPNRDNFMNEIDQESFDRLVEKYCTDKLPNRIIKKGKLIVRKVLEKVGLLDVAKQLIGKCHKTKEDFFSNI